ncbi:autotransporter outer membrane beta-barrel domain-containing protein [Rhodohalobacter halophilus]|uniref:hypothetical protein n=1 Tax=Rhodohalobacter halophilus TaxID=1812810 RepID=UPI00083F6168|nr:hypothetical protein [Rhodohalobacter halophilus]
MKHSISTLRMFLMMAFPILLLLSCDAESITQPPSDTDDPDAEFSYGGSNDDLGKTIIQTSDGGYLIIGTTTSSDGLFSGLARGNRDVFALKLSSNGNQQWVNTYGGSNSEWAMDVIEDSQGNYVITGYSRSDDGQFQNLNRGENDIFLLKISANGSFINALTYGGNDEDYGYTVTENPGGGYLIAGSTRSINGNFSSRSNSSLDAFVLRTDFNGQPLWTQILGGSDNDEAFDLVIDSNSQITVAGSFTSSDSDFSGRNPGERGGFLWKLEPNGAFSALYSYSGSGADTFSSITTTSDNGFAIAGYTTSDDNFFQGAGNGQTDAFILKTNTFGSVEWLNIYGGSNLDELNDITESNSGNLFAVGRSGSDDGDFQGLNLGNRDIIMASTALNGSENFLRSYGGDQDEIGESVVGASNGNIAFTGWTLSNNGNFSGPQKSGRDIFKLLISPSGEVE